MDKVAGIRPRVQREAALNWDRVRGRRDETVTVYPLWAEGCSIISGGMGIMVRRRVSWPRAPKPSLLFPGIQHVQNEYDD